MRWKKKLTIRLSKIQLSWGIYVRVVGKENSGITALIKNKKPKEKPDLRDSYSQDVVGDGLLFRFSH